MIDEVHVGATWHDFTFCSTYAYSHSTTPNEDLIMVKNPLNALHNSNYYSGSNRDMLKDLRQHSAAVSRCLMKTYGGVLIHRYAEALGRISENVQSTIELDKEQYHAGSMGITTMDQERFVLALYAKLRGITEWELYSILV